MTLLKGDGARIIDKFIEKYFNTWRFKIDIRLASMDIWGIVDKSKASSPSNVDPLVKKDCQRRVKKTMSIIAFSSVDNQLGHIRGFKGPAKAWKILCNIHKTRSLANILFVHRKFFTCKKMIICWIA